MNTTSATEPVGWIPDPTALPVTRVDEARIAAFIAAHNLGDWVEQALRLARDAFPRAKEIALRMFGEPGEYGERLFVEAATGVGVDESLRQYEDCVARWVVVTPPWVRDLMGIGTDLS